MFLNVKRGCHTFVQQPLLSYKQMKTQRLTLAAPSGRGFLLQNINKEHNPCLSLWERCHEVTERASTLYNSFPRNSLPSLTPTKRESTSLPPLYTTKLSCGARLCGGHLLLSLVTKVSKSTLCGLTSASMKITVSAFIYVFLW